MSIKAVTMGLDGGALPIKEFKLNTMVEHPSIVLVAKRGSGKSVVCKALLNEFKDYPVGIIISKSENLNCFYSEFFPKAFIHDEYKSEIMERLLVRQKAIIRKNNERIEKGKKPIDTRIFIVMDDCLSDSKTWMRDKPILEVLYNGRHYHITYILTLQYVMGITPSLRANFDYVFLLAEDQYDNQIRIYKTFASIFPTLKDFTDVYKELTKDYGALLIVRRGANATFLEKVYWYKAPFGKLMNIKLGCDQFRKFDENNYDPKWEDKHGQFNIDEYCMRKKQDKSLIKVDKIQIDDKGNKVDKRKTYH